MQLDLFSLATRMIRLVAFVLDSKKMHSFLVLLLKCHCCIVIAIVKRLILPHVEMAHLSPPAGGIEKSRLVRQ